MTTDVTSGWRSLHRRFAFRLVAAMLLVSVPLMVAMAMLLTTSASSSLSASAQDEGESVARALTLRLEDWVSDRQQSLRVLATAASGRLAAKETGSALVKVDGNYDDFSLIELTDLTGKVLATSRAGNSVDVAGQDWFQTAAAGQPVVTSLIRQGDSWQHLAGQVGELDQGEIVVVAIPPDQGPTRSPSQPADPLAAVASFLRLCCRRTPGASNRRASETRLEPEAGRLDDAEVVNDVAIATINGTDTNNIAATDRNAKRRCSGWPNQTSRGRHSTSLCVGGCGFEVAGEVVEVAGGGGDLWAVAETGDWRR